MAEAIKGPSQSSGWPKAHEGQKYVLDNQGVIWLLVPEYDGGMATTADASSIWSVGLNTLMKERGPLYIIAPTQFPSFLDHLPTLRK